MKIQSKTILSSIVIIIGILLFISISLYNKYPLLTPDSGGYINSGFAEKIGNHRPIIYGLFVRHISLAESLWFVVIFQGIILTYILLKIMDSFSQTALSFNKKTAIFFIITIFTGISWYCSQIMTDIFTGIGIMIMLLLILKKINSKVEFIFLLIIMLFSILTHKSHMLIFTATIASTGIIAWRKRLFNKRIIIKHQYIVVCFVVVFSWFIMPLINMSFSDNYKLKSNAHVFIMGRLIETGMIKRVLDDNCKEKDLVLCPYADSLPTNHGEFLWSPNSPLRKTGKWEKSKKEYKKIIMLSFSRPKYIFIHLKDAISAIAGQLIHFNVGKLLNSQTNHKPLVRAIKKHYHYEYNQFITSLQNKGKLDFNKVNTRRNAYLIFCVLFMLVGLRFIKNNTTTSMQYFLIFMLVFFVLNTMLTAPLAGISDRYQGRIIWIFPFITTVIIADNVKIIKQSILDQLKNRN